MKLRCYCCGKPLLHEVVLVAMSEDVDRVFLVHPRCLPLVKNDAAVAVHVVEATK